MKTMHSLSTDVAIIGAGPVGLFTVFEMGLLGYSCVVLDSLPEVGGQLNALYPEKPIYDIPGYPQILAGALSDKLVEQAAPFNPTYVLGNEVQGLKGEAGHFTLTAGDTEVHCKVIVIAAGSGMFTPRKPPLDNLADFENTSLFYAIRNKQQFNDKTVVIAGGGDSAIDWTVELAQFAKHVHVVHRRNDFRAAESMVAAMRQLETAGKVSIHAPAQLARLEGSKGQLSHVILSDLAGGETSLAADNLLCFFGLAPSLGPLAAWGLGISRKKVVCDPSTMQTSIPGILGAGDITEYPGKLDLILTGFAESAIAAKTAQSIIHPEKRFKLIYTTSSGIPGHDADAPLAHANG